MTNSPSQPGIPLFPDNRPPRGLLQKLAANIGEFVRAGLAIVFWLLVTAAAVAVGYVIMRCLLWGIAMIQKALGIP